MAVSRSPPGAPPPVQIQKKEPTVGVVVTAVVMRDVDAPDDEGRSRGRREVLPGSAPHRPRPMWMAGRGAGRAMHGKKGAGSRTSASVEGGR